jgi:AraC-like DNA-binding protein
MRFSILLLLAVFPVMLQSSETISVTDRIARLGDLPLTEFRLQVDTVYLALQRDTSRSRVLELTEQVFAITRQRDKQAHIRSLANPVIYPDSLRLRYFIQALAIARALKSQNEVLWIEDRRCRFYLQRQQYDSAMVSLLRMRDQYSPESGDENILNIYQLLGDIYYRGKLYRQAEETYRQVLAQFEINGRWDYWRPYVIMNNLGLIALRTGNFPEARDIFTRSLRMARIQLRTSDRNNIIAYILIELAETAMAQGDLIAARRWLDEARAIPSGEIFPDVRPRLQYRESRLLLAEGSLSAAQQSLGPLLKLPGNSLFDAKVILLQSEIFKLLGAVESSLQLLQRYVALNDSLNQQSSLTRSLIILAEHKQQINKERLAAAERERHLSRLAIVILLLVLAVISILYRRLHHSKLALVEQAVLRREPEPAAEVPRSDHDADHDELAGLAAQLDRVMQTEKLFLDPHFSINKAAEFLGTNRTYLSRAINSIQQTNFPGYINRFRIREAIRLISEGFADNLTQEALASQCGFSNRAVFINAFKKHTGVTPSFFIRKYKKHPASPERFPGPAALDKHSADS